MGDPARVVAVGDYRREALGDAEASLCLGQQHDAAVRCDPAAVERGRDLLTRHRRQIEGEKRIVDHDEPIAPQSPRACRFGKRIMPQTHV